MQGIYNYIPETHCVPRVYNVAAILYFYVSTSRSMCAVPNMAVLYSSLVLRFPSMLLRYLLIDFKVVPVQLLIILLVSH